MQPDRFRNDRTKHLDLENTHFNPFDIFLAVPQIPTLADSISINDYLGERGEWIDGTQAYYEDLLRTALLAAGITEEDIAVYDWRKLAIETTQYSRGEYFKNISEQRQGNRYDRAVMDNHPVMESIEKVLAPTTKLSVKEKMFAKTKVVAFLGMTGLISYKNPPVVG